MRYNNINNRFRRNVPNRNSFRRLYESGDFDYLYEDDEEFSEDDEAPKQMTDEKLKVESLKIAISISKLMSDVQVDDVVKIAETVADFIRNRDIEDYTDEDADDFSRSTHDDDEEDDDVSDEI